jgi:glycosyltransferase involved in cell wall biosynthesis
LNPSAQNIGIAAIVTARNREEQTLANLGRILNCTPPPDEILVHIDGGNHQLADKISRSFPSVIVHVHDGARGPGGARNFLLAATDCPFVASFDDDSYPLDSRFFELAVSEFKAHPEAAVFCAVILDCDGPSGPAFEGIRRVASFVGCGCIYRRTAFFATTGYVPLELAYGMEELDLSMQFHALALPLLQSDKLRVHHDTDMRHRASPKVNVAVTANAALLVYLRYPLLLWPIGLLQVARTVLYLIRSGRSEGVWTGITQIPAHLYRHRSYRKTLRVSDVLSYIRLRRRSARENVPV